MVTPGSRGCEISVAWNKTERQETHLCPSWFYSSQRRRQQQLLGLVHVQQLEGAADEMLNKLNTRTCCF